LGKFREVFYISNLLSLARIGLLIPFYFSLTAQTQMGNSLAVVVMLLGALTDYLDGYFARTYQQQTDLGRILDPLADKLCMVIGAWLLITQRSLPVWYFVILAARDLSILLLALFIATKTRVVVESNVLGKFTAGAISLTLFSFTVQLDVVKWIFLWLSLWLVLASSLRYLQKVVNMLRGIQPTYRN
jgi:CDP-diacylglycerol--glycerol-3-phosphate 3-phosphatidyltransferase